MTYTPEYCISRIKDGLNCIEVEPDQEYIRQTRIWVKRLEEALDEDVLFKEMEEKNRDYLDLKDTQEAVVFQFRPF